MKKALLISTGYKRKYTDRHLRDWFVKLPSYQTDVQRRNQVADVFAPRLERLITEQESNGPARAWLMDSLIAQKSGIELASKVRSYAGFMVPVFGRLAAAVFIYE